MHTRYLTLELVDATESAVLNSLPWIGKGDKESADAAASDAIRRSLESLDIRGQVIVGEGIKDNSPGIFAGERVGTWREGSPFVDIAVDPIDGTTNLSKGLPNAISCIAIAVRATEGQFALQHIPAFYLNKLAYSRAVRNALALAPGLSLDLNAPIKETITLTARLLDKSVAEVVVMVLDRPRNVSTIEQIRSSGAQLRMIGDGDITAALAPAFVRSGVDLYVGIGGAAEGVLAAVGLRSLGGELKAQMWRDDSSSFSQSINEGWDDTWDTPFCSRDLAKSDDLAFVATGICDSLCLRGARVGNGTVATDSILISSHDRAIRQIRTEHCLSRSELRSGNALPRKSRSSVEHPDLFPVLRPSSPGDVVSSATQARQHYDRGALYCILLFGAPGSGKGTIGKSLGALPGYTHISSGDLIRGALESATCESDKGLHVASGQLLSDDELWRVFDSYLDAFRTRGSDDSITLILDGIPRTRSQVEELSKRVYICGVLHLDCYDESVLLRRLSQRYSKEGRSDDANTRTILARLKLYRDQTLPLLNLFRDHDIVHIDATKPPDTTMIEVLQYLVSRRGFGRASA